MISDGALYLAPIGEDPKRCFDFATGTGIWAIDFADEFPGCEVIGTDLSPIQPSAIPPNLRFYVDDVEGDWGFRSDEAFDLIHGRGMGGALKDWPRLFRQIYSNLKPGGWVEMQEYAAWLYSKGDPSLDNCPNVKRWLDLVNESSAKFGKEIDMAHRQKQLMEDAGFVDVQERPFAIPLGTWAKGKKAKELGVLKQQVVLESVDAFTMPMLTRIMNWEVQDCEELMAECSTHFVPIDPLAIRGRC